MFFNEKYKDLLLLQNQLIFSILNCKYVIYHERTWIITESIIYVNIRGCTKEFQFLAFNVLIKSKTAFSDMLCVYKLHENVSYSGMWIFSFSFHYFLDFYLVFLSDSVLFAGDEMKCKTAWYTANTKLIDIFYFTLYCGIKL